MGKLAPGLGESTFSHARLTPSQVLDAPPKAIKAPSSDAAMELELPLPVPSSCGVGTQSATAADGHKDSLQRQQTVSREHVMQAGGMPSYDDAQTAEPVVQQAIAVGS
jgi:hypothetical protein